MMNKKLFLLALPLLLASCNARSEVVKPVSPVEEPEVAVETTPEVVEEEIVNENEFTIFEENGLPVVRSGSSTFKTYLMMSPRGSLNVAGSNVKGKVSELFLENTIVWEAEPGTALPTNSSEVVIDVPGATFRGWAYYDEESEEIFPTYYKTVPTQAGLALKAIFDGTISSGTGGGGGGSTPTTDSGFGIYYSAENIVKATELGEKDPQGRDQYLCSNLSFKKDDAIKLYDYKNKAAFISDVAFNGWSFGSTGSGEKISQYLVVEGDAWRVMQDFNADVYIQLKFGDNCIYFELK